MNQALAFGLLLAGGVTLEAGLTGKGLSAVLQGKAGAVPKTGTMLSVAGAGGAIAGAATAGQVNAATGAVGGYTNPIPGAAAGRTDQGVDATLTPGAPILALGRSKVIGIIPNWFSGQPFVWLQLLDGSAAGKYYYVAEQITPSVRPGQVVNAGEPIGTYSSSGTGLELGWATSTGQTLARATTGYVEGEATQAGQSFRQFLTSLGFG
jgi:hypothetical protein